MIALAERLAPVQDTLAELEREARAQANEGNAPDAWAAWSDLYAALMAVRAAQGRDARARRHEAPCGPERPADPMADADPKGRAPCCGQRAAKGAT